MGHLLRRMQVRLSKAEGLTATAHKLARVVYGMIKAQKSDDEQEAFKPNPSQRTTTQSPSKTSCLPRFYPRSRCVIPGKLVGRLKGTSKNLIHATK